jgi:hypothetical protein
MKFCFICTSYEALGGVETLLLRMSQWLTEHGHDVCLLTNAVDDLHQELPMKVALGNKFAYLQDIWRTKLYFRQLCPMDFDVIKSFHIYDSYSATIIANAIGRKVKLIAGIYTPQQLTYAGATKPHLDNFLKNIPIKSRLVCFADSLKELRDSSNDPTQGAIYWPPPVGDIAQIFKSRLPQNGKIVSIGRLAPMKEYNLFMINLIRDLVGMGYNVNYHIYGDGPYEDEVKERILQCRLEKRVIFHGRLPYHRMHDALADAHLFVGMGTSMIEAAQNGVPSLGAVPFDSSGLSYGPIYNIPTESVSQQRILTTAPSRRMIDDIKRILDMSNDDYQAECKRTYNYSAFWSLDNRMHEFVEIVKNAPYFKTQPLYHQIDRCKRMFCNMEIRVRRRLANLKARLHAGPPLPAKTK